jgi:hypothetical protein
VPLRRDGRRELIVAERQRAVLWQLSRRVDRLGVNELGASGVVVEVNTQRLIHRVGGLESPAPGRWPIARGSYLAIVPARGAGPVPARIVTGHIDVDELNRDTTIELTLGTSTHSILRGDLRGVTANRFGTPEWAIEGTLSSDAGTEAVSLRLVYHGVYRQSGRAWAWFSGRGTSCDNPPCPPRGRRRDRRSSVVVDLLFEAPAATSTALTAA